MERLRDDLVEEGKKERVALPSLYEYYIEGDGWDSDHLDKAVARLYTYNFFKRFSKMQLRHFLRNISLQTFEPDEIIFVEEPVVFVVLNGLAHLRTHEKDLINPECIAMLGRSHLI